jgi:hypothetical protein
VEPPGPGGWGGLTYIRVGNKKEFHIISATTTRLKIISQLTMTTISTQPTAEEQQPNKHRRINTAKTSTIINRRHSKLPQQHRWPIDKIISAAETATRAE